MSVPADRAHWARWTLIGFNKTVISIAGAYPVYLEGDERTTNVFTDYCEVRLDGPDLDEKAKDQYFLDCTMDLLINHKLDTKNLYGPELVIGQFQAAFKHCIDIHRLGDLPVDDDSFVGSYILQGPIEINKFGIIDKDVRLVQATLSAPYRMTLQV